MGAQNFVNRASGKRASEAYDKLYEEAVYEYGHDPYNGTISTCDMGRCTLSFKEYKEENEVKAYDHIKEMGYGVKWTANYIDLGYDKKIKANRYIFYGWAAC